MARIGEGDPRWLVEQRQGTLPPSLPPSLPTLQSVAPPQHHPPPPPAFRCVVLADGKNVNNWHWVEKDCLEWSSSRLKELLSGLVCLDGPITFKITCLDSCTGDAVINNR